MGLSLGHGAAVYVGFTISILMGPTAFATPPVLKLLLKLVFARVEAVAVPSAKARLFDANPLRDKDDDEEGIELDSELEVEGEGTDMCSLAGA
mmetsp:Transcript_19844/g.32133  ORF Transcript_19844/g.32133 Transcript_19844/m.32133 type:complete len:93 (+) Transcript_19844:725-1003(+)